MNRHFFSILTLLLLALLTSCRESREVNALLSQADSLMNTRPDSALLILEEAREEVVSCPRSQRMRHELLVAKAQNKAYVDFTTDSIMLTVTDYYDHHGTPNERMLAHYLLGCTYRDMGEAPRTLECYKDAVACADTLSPDCDYRTMMSIYGQMATLYDKQVMPMEELNALECSGWYALKCEDTLNYIKSIQLKTQVYSLLQDTAGIYKSTDIARALFIKHGYIEEAAQALAIAIYKKLESNQFHEADSMLQIYETQSGRFDEDGTVQPRFSHYYDYKGKYFLGIHKLDSSELYYRKLLAAGYLFDAYRGLEHVYQERKNSDSVILYSRLSEEALDQRFTEISRQSIRQAEAMYDYSRHQQIAHKREIEVAHMQRKMLSMAFICLILLIAAYLLYYRQKKQKEEKIKEKLQEILNLSILLGKSQEESRLAKQNLAEYESLKQKEIEILKKQLKQGYLSFQEIKDEDKIKAFMESKTVIAFKNMAVPKPHQKVPSDKLWKELTNATMGILPSFHNKISITETLSCQEYRTTLLTRLDFSVGEIAVLLGTTPQRISNAKRSANFKLFGEENAQTFANNIRKL